MSKYDSLFAKIPNGVIELSNRINSYTSLTYLFLAINRNMLGKVNSSILFLEECYVDDSMENQKTKASKISKILSSLYLLVFVYYHISCIIFIIIHYKFYSLLS